MAKHAERKLFKVDPTSIKIDEDGTLIGKDRDGATRYQYVCSVLALLKKQIEKNEVSEQEAMFMPKDLQQNASILREAFSRYVYNNPEVRGKYTRAVDVAAVEGRVLYNHIGYGVWRRDEGQPVSEDPLRVFVKSINGSNQ